MDDKCAKVSIESLKVWNEISPIDSFEKNVKIHKFTPFPINECINKKVALWVGDITLLNCHAIVNTTNENFTESSPLCSGVVEKGGKSLKNYLHETLKVCRCGDAKISEGYNLFARYIIHTVGPWYKPKFHSAGENLLYSCYSKVLQIVKEQNIRTLALPPINTVRRRYPPQEGAHIGLRVVRRFLEKFHDDIDLIVFVVSDADVGLYESLMPLYFPRSKEEEEAALYNLTENVGGQDGEPYLVERRIRISGKPIRNREDSLEDSVDLKTEFEASVVVGKSSFAQMDGDFDKKRQSSSCANCDPISAEILRQSRYERLVFRSKAEDLAEISALKCLYLAGEDKFGRSIVVFIGKKFRSSNVSLKKALLYLINVLDRAVKKEYIVIYFHTLTTAENHPPLSFVRYVYEQIDARYKKNLKSFFIVHPTIWIKFFSWWFTTFSATNLKQKVNFLSGMEYLRNIVPIGQLQLPSFIMDYDFKINGVKYAAKEVFPSS